MHAGVKPASTRNTVAARIRHARMAMAAPVSPARYKTKAIRRAIS